jgi:hypothetical protein
MNAADRNRLRRYGVTPEQWVALLDDSGGRCRLCAKPWGPSRPPVLDHQHREPYLVRGVICGPCNHELGRRADDGRWYACVHIYLRSVPARQIIGPIRVPTAPPETTRAPSGDGALVVSPEMEKPS